MNAMLPLFAAGSHPSGGDKPANLMAAARALTPHLGRGRTLDRALVAQTMTLCFGATDAEGGWLWRDAYDAIELAVVLQMRRLAPQLARLEDAPAQIAALLAGLNALTLTHTRRSEEQVALDQFSTPPELAAIVVAAAQIRPGDRVLEPSAGTGIIAVMAEACGATLTLNEIAETRAGLLGLAFPTATRRRVDGAQVHNIEGAGGYHAVVTNPPFQHLEAHLASALGALADGGRLSAVVPARLFDDAAALRRLGFNARLVAMIAFPPQAYAKHGTSVETGLLVMDRASPELAIPPRRIQAEDLASLAGLAAALEPRPNARPRAFRSAPVVALSQTKARGSAGRPSRFAFLAEAAPVAYAPRAGATAGADIGLYQSYQVAIAIPGAHPHPAALVEAQAMASVTPPTPTYRPVLPEAIVCGGLLSEAQLETVIYAGEAHAKMLPGRWAPTDHPHLTRLAPEDAKGAIRLRQGFFLGDGTGLGKGRQIAGVIADNIAQGRTKAVWISKNDPLLDDARRDWTAIGGAPEDIVAQSSWKQGETIALDRGILYTT